MKRYKEIIHFHSCFNEVNTFAQNVPNEQIKNEPMFFNSGFDFAMEKGGPITHAFLNALPKDWKSEPLVFDSRVHMLMPGWYPAIPGWHHDDVARTPENRNQPDYINMPYHSEHILGLVNADVCPTLFIEGDCIMTAPPIGEVVYKVWNDEIEAKIKNEEVEVTSAKDRTLYRFDYRCFHTATKATAVGWRWFGRVSRNTDRVKNITNEIRVNAQVYLEFPTNGW